MTFISIKFLITKKNEELFNTSKNNIVSKNETEHTFLLLSPVELTNSHKIKIIPRIGSRVQKSILIKLSNIKITPAGNS